MKKLKDCLWYVFRKFKSTQYQKTFILYKTENNSKKKYVAYLEGKVFSAYFNKQCFTYEETTEENGHKLKCII